MEKLNSSSINAMAGWASEIEEVIPARKSSINHIKPKILPKAIFSITSGIVTKPRLKEPPEAILAAP